MQLALDTVGERYDLQKVIGTGGMGTVYRAKDRLSGKLVALKRVTLGEKEIDFATHPYRTGGQTSFRLALAQEFRTLASLRHPHIISVLDYGFDEQQHPFYTMDLLQEAQDVITSGQERPFSDQVALLMQLLQALAYLHRRGIIHRDLKPDNVLVVGRHLRVLDFGLAVAREHLDDARRQGIVGTIAYLAPELLREAPPGTASDLYAVGVIAYELLSGRHPFATDSYTTLFQEILTNEPDLEQINAGTQVRQILYRLLHKDPARRYASARAVIADLAAATGQSIWLEETEQIRESFLQAARFTGRDAELAQLTDALQATRAGWRSTWLVGGESGVGKSRLLDELRAQALVEGVPVWRGQAIREGSTAYQSWLPVLRRLCLHIVLTDLEAGVLKSLIPDLPQLINRSVPDAPDLDAQATQERLLNVIEELFARIKQPTIVILEDLQWATGESLAVLQRLSHSPWQAPLLLIGSYRDEERPDLPQKLPEAEVLRLARLQPAAIAELMASMLGPNGKQPELVGLIRRETEGNAFFIVEVVRALAEEAGQLANIGAGDLPQTVAARGVATVIQRRLQQVPAQARPLLQVAATLGRELDLPVLRAAQPETDLLAWLNTCADTAVLEIQDERWRFSHDKLREGLLAELTPEAGVTLHRQAAAALEAVHGRSRQHAAALAYHWTAAGDAEKAARFDALAGETALQNGALEEAAHLLQQALALQEDLPTSPLKSARTHRLLAEALNGLGQLSGSITHTEKAFALLGSPIPEKQPALMLSLLGQAARQVGHRISQRMVAQAGETAVIRELLAAYPLTETYAWSGDQARLLYANLLALNKAEQLGESFELATSFSIMGYVMSLIPWRGAAARYRRKGEEVAKAVDDLPTWAMFTRFAGLQQLAGGEWEAAEKNVQESIKLFERLGNQRVRMFNMLQSITIAKYQGHTDEARRRVSQMEAVAERNQNQQYLSWSKALRALFLLRQGEHAPAVALLREADAYLDPSLDTLGAVLVRGQLALACLRQGEREMAVTTAESALNIMTEAAMNGHGALEGYPSVVEVYHTLWTGETDPAYANSMKEKTGQALQVLRKYARIFPLGRPRANLWRGAFHAQQQRQWLANFFWQRGLAAAQELRMPYDEGLLHWHIGRHAPPAGEKRARHLAAATACFRQVGATYELSLVEKIAQP